MKAESFFNKYTNEYSVLGENEEWDNYAQFLEKVGAENEKIFKRK